MIVDPLTLSSEVVASQIAKLTPRQLEIIAHIASGQSDKGTANILSIKRGTVRKHVQHALERIGAENRTQLIVIFAMWKTESHHHSPKGLHTHSSNSAHV